MERGVGTQMTGQAVRTESTTRVSRHVLASRPARVLIVEEEGKAREMVETALLRQGFVVRSDPEGSGVDWSVRAFEPDIAIIGHDLPRGPSGCAVVAQLRTRGSLPIVLLGSTDSLAQRLSGFNAGADDYISTPFDMEELLARVAALLRRVGRSPAKICRVSDVLVDDAAYTVTRNGANIKLRRLEHDVLSVLCRSAGRCVSKQELLDQAWHGIPFDDDNTVEVHICTLRRKLEAHGPRLIHTVRSVGYLLRP